MKRAAMVILIGALAAMSAARAQFMTKLDERTAQEFDRYAKGVEQELSTRWHGHHSYLAIDENRAERERVLDGRLSVEPGTTENPVEIPNGLIHDWIGLVFIPNATINRVLSVLEDYDRHAQIYPGITQSRLLRRNGNEVVGYWRLERPDPLLRVVLDVEQEAHYEQIGPGKWTGRAYTRSISEIEKAGTSRERKLPPGEGHGFLWKFNAYWSLESVAGGVLAECRTLSLSRDIPGVLAWAIKPFVQKLPRESLVATLEHTREAATK